MGKPRIFSTAAITAMQDLELSGQDWRVYMWVSLHDGRSLFTGKGKGCIASNKTIFAEAGCDYTSGCRSLSKLVARGHLIREQNGRATVYRLTWPDPDNLQDCNISPDLKGSRAASGPAEIACKPKSQVTEKPRRTEGEYIPPSGELNSVETGEINLLQEAHFAGAKSAAIRKVTLKEILPKDFNSLSLKAKLVRWEVAFEGIGRDASRLEYDSQQVIARFLHDICMEHFEDNAIGGHAQRLWEEVGVF